MKLITFPTCHYPLHLDDGGRNLSRRPYQGNDCTVRALAIVLQMQYDDVYDMLKKAKRKSHEGFDITKWMSKANLVLKENFVRINKRGLTPLNFTSHYPKGRFLLQNEDHVWAVVDGVHRDMIRVKDEPLCEVHQVKI